RTKKLIDEMKHEDYDSLLIGTDISINKAQAAFTIHHAKRIEEAREQESGTHKPLGFDHSTTAFFSFTSIPIFLGLRYLHAFKDLPLAQLLT
ncbi:hypothetical protein ACJX0J_005792, partial [Zea mays]